MLHISTSSVKMTTNKGLGGEVRTVLTVANNGRGSDMAKIQAQHYKGRHHQKKG